jgi:hypothetical protein
MRARRTGRSTASWRANSASIRNRCSCAINDKERFSEILRDALEFIYQVFGTEDLVITHELELLHPPRQAHPPMKIS